MFLIEYLNALFLGAGVFTSRENAEQWIVAGAQVKESYRVIEVPINESVNGEPVVLPSGTPTMYRNTR